MRSLFNLILGLLLTGNLLYCSRDARISGGTETGDVTIIAGVILHPDNHTPAADVEVSLVDPAPIEAIIVKTTRTDSQGRFRFDTLPAILNDRHYTIYARLDTAICMIDSVFIGATESVVMAPAALQVAGALAGVVRGDDFDIRNGCRIGLAGTPLWHAVSADTQFVLPYVPAGIYTCILYHPEGRCSVEEQQCTITVADTNRLPLPFSVRPVTLYLDNFDDGDRFSLLQGVLDSIYWAVWDYTTDKGGNTLLPEGVFEDFSKSLAASSAYSGFSVSMQCFMNPELSIASSGVECYLCAPSESLYVDLSHLRSVSLMARGRGALRASFTSRRVVQYPTGQNYGQLGTIFNLDSTWTSITIPVDSLIPHPGSPQEKDSLKWDDVKSHVSKFVIGVWAQPGDTVEFSLDDISFQGVVPADLDNPRP